MSDASEMGKPDGGNPGEPACPRCGTIDRERRILGAVQALTHAVFGNPGTQGRPQGRVNSVPWQALQILRDNGGDMTIAEVATAVEARFGRGDRKTPVRGSVGSVLPMLGQGAARASRSRREGSLQGDPRGSPADQGRRRCRRERGMRDRQRRSTGA